MEEKHAPGGWRIGDAGFTIFGPKKPDGSLPETIATIKNKAYGELLRAAPETAAHCDRLRAALEQAAASLAVQAATARELAETSNQHRIANAHLADAGRQRAVIVYKDILANTSPAPVDSVNKELLDA